MDWDNMSEQQRREYRGFRFFNHVYEESWFGSPDLGGFEENEVELELVNEVGEEY